MTSIVCIGAVTALAVFVIVMKTRTSGPKKVNKSEKADIMKQLLALSDGLNGTPVIPPSRPRTPHVIPRSPSRRFPPKPLVRASQPAPPAQGRC
jgi:hypothetical protein